jgi:hypothetical protein
VPLSIAFPDEGDNGAAALGVPNGILDWPREGGLCCHQAPAPPIEAIQWRRPALGAFRNACNVAMKLDVLLATPLLSLNDGLGVRRSGAAKPRPG